MRKFGLSENFIYMDDDYFIGQPLKKSDFFYEYQGEIYPFLITDCFKEMNKTELEEKQENIAKEILIIIIEKFRLYYFCIKFSGITIREGVFR